MVEETVFGVATALGNLFGNQSVNSQKREALSRYRKQLIDAKYDPVEKAREVDRVGDAFNTEIANSMNSSAFGLGRYLNSGTARAVSSAKLMGQRSGAMVETSSKIDEYNSKIDLQLAESELQTPVSDPLGDIISGGAAGLQLGMSIGNYQSELEFSAGLLGNLKKMNSGGTSQSWKGINFDATNPVNLSNLRKYRLGRK